MRICMHGAGGLGSLMGAFLAKSGHEVWLVARPAHVDAVNRGGLQITGITGEQTIKAGLHATASIGDIEGPIDLYVLTVKAKDTATALAQAKAAKLDVSMAMSLQNTVVKDDALIDTFGERPVIGASTIEGATLLEPGVVRHTATCPTTAYFGELNGTESDRAHDVTKAFDDAGFASKCVNTIRQVEWEKLLQIATVSPWSVCTLAAVPWATVADGMSNRPAAELYVMLAQDLLRVYQSLGYEPEDYYAPYSRYRELVSSSFEDAVERVLAQGAMMKANNLVGKTSMHEDVLRGRRTEAPEVLRPFLDQAQKAGLDVPVLRTIAQTVFAIDELLE